MRKLYVYFFVIAMLTAMVLQASDVLSDCIDSEVETGECTNEVHTLNFENEYSQTELESDFDAPCADSVEIAAAPPESDECTSEVHPLDFENECSLIALESDFDSPCSVSVEKAAPPESDECTSEVHPLDFGNECFPIALESDFDTPCADSTRWSNPVCIYGTYSIGDSPGICCDYGTAGVFIAPCLRPCCFAPILDASFNYLHDGMHGASAGLGLRLASADLCSYAGAYVAYDYLKGAFRDYHQVCFGCDFIGKNIEVRVNGYLPVGKTKGEGPLIVYDDYDNTGAATPYVVTVFNEELALTGFDAEAGPRFCRCFADVFVGAGPYFFHNDGFGDLWGVKAVLRVLFSDWLYFEGQVTHDRKFDTLKRGVVGLCLPLWGNCREAKSCIPACIVQKPFYRDKPIHLSDCCRYQTNY